MKTPETNKINKDLKKLALICATLYMGIPLMVAITIRYADEIDAFFTMRNQIICFLLIILAGASAYLFRRRW